MRTTDKPSFAQGALGTLISWVFKALGNFLSTVSFVRSNVRIWKKPLGSKNPKILVEFNGLSSSHVAYGYLANVMSEVDNARITPVVAESGKLRAEIPLGRLARVLYAVRHPLLFLVYRSIGGRGFVYPVRTLARLSEAQRIVSDFFDTEPTNRDLENFAVSDVLIGDLFYDTYLRKNFKPTIDMKDPFVGEALVSFIQDVLFWIDYFAHNVVSGVIVSHTVYGIAVPLRVAIYSGVPAFQATAISIYRLSKDNLFAYNDFASYPAVFRKMTASQRHSARKAAREEIALRLGAAIETDVPQEPGSAPESANSRTVLKRSTNPKVLVATHCFFDSPHPYGSNLFPDFWEWLEYLGKISNRTSYDWYLKAHPHRLPGNVEILERFTNTYPRFALLPGNVPHRQIIAEGIDVALTVYGTIGGEYPYLGVPVINASTNNPHRAYSFNFHPASLDEYERMILSIPKLGRVGSDVREEVEEFYFAKYRATSDNLFFENWEATLIRTGGHESQFSPNVYREFLNEWTASKHAEIIGRIGDFLGGSDYVLKGP